jgi:hypothetical protein
MATCSCNDGWVCAWPHNDCIGRSVLCVHPDCPHGQWAIARKPTDDAITRERYPDLFRQRR